MIPRAKAAFARTAPAGGNRLGRLLRGVFAGMGASTGGDGSSAPASASGRARLLALVGVAALLASLTLLSTTAFASEEPEFIFGEEGQASAITAIPEGVAVDQTNGDVYVADGYGHRINKFEWNGTPLFAWGVGIVNGAEEEQTCTTNCIQSYFQPFEPQTIFTPFLANAGAAAVDPTGEHDLYVIDTNGGYSRIEKFKPNGEFLFAFGGDTVAYGPGDSTNNAVQILKVKATGGHYELHFEYPWARAYSGGFSGSSETPAIEATASAAEIETALNNLGTVSSTIVGGSIAVKEIGTGEFELTFGGNLAGDHVPTIRPEYSGPPPTGSSLTGGEEKAEVEVKNPGGAAEVCKKGEHCKWGGTGTANGEFQDGSHYQGIFYSAFPDRATDIAVGPTGTVYVGDNKRVQEFSPEGEYIGQINLETPAGDNNLTYALAVDHEGNVFVLSELFNIKEELENPGGYKRTYPPVKEYNAKGELVRELKTEPEGKPVRQRTLTVDPAGDIFVGEELNHPSEPIFAWEFAGYKPDGTYYAQFTSPEIKRVYEEFFVSQAAVGLHNYLYVTVLLSSYSTPRSHMVAMKLPEPGEPKAEAKPVTNIEPKTATLHGVVNPEGYSTEYHFEYGETETYGHSTKSTPIGLVIANQPVQAPISNLKPGTLYHWRLVAESHCKESEPTVVCKAVTADETFETLTPVSVRSFATQTVGPELVTIKAELNPNGDFSTYKFRYGTDSSYTCEPQHECVQEGELAPGNEFVLKEATFTGLKPNTTYHYQLTAENEFGEYTSSDATFTTELSSSEEAEREHCPNKTQREENNSLLLPDCRAWEQVTPDEMNGGEAFPYLGFSPNGERALFYSEGAFAGAVGNQLFIPYVTQRTPNGWETQAMVRRPLPPPYEPLDIGLLFSPNMDRWLFSESKGLNAEEAGGEQTELFYSMGLLNPPHTTITHATGSIGLVEGGPTYAYQLATIQFFSEEGSESFSRMYDLTSRKLMTSDPRPDEQYGANGREGTRIYEISGVPSENAPMRLVAEVPPGLAENGCDIDNENNSELRGARYLSTDGRVLFYTGPIEKEKGKPCGEGSRAGEIKPNPIGIFAHISGPNEEGKTVQVDVPWHCTAPNPCATAPTQLHRYDNISEDGSRVWFTSEQPMVNSDGDKPVAGMTGRDLYVAKLNTQTDEVTELVQASAGESTSTHPNPGENADIGETGVTEEGGDKSTGVVTVSRDGSHGVFESPAVLTTEANGVGDSAVQGANNMYEYDANTNKVKFVAKLCSGPEETGTNYSKYTPHDVHPVEVGVTAVRDTQCPKTVSPWVQTFANTTENDSQLWFESGGYYRARMTPDGRYLAFLSYGRLTPDDTANNKLQLFRYDFNTGQLIRISVGHAGNDGNFNDPRYGVAGFNENGELAGNGLAENGGRMMSSDGSRIIFQTEAPLTSHDHNTGKQAECSVEGTGCDVYEWEEDGHGTCEESAGCVFLISDGVAVHGSEHGVISSPGGDIAFGTQEDLTPSDTNGLGDIYDARELGGFHAPLAPPPCSTSESCLHQPASPPSQATVSTPNFEGPENNVELHKRCAKGKVRVVKNGHIRCVAKKHGGKRRKHRGRAAVNPGGRK